jgi:hypothetical protein
MFCRDGCFLLGAKGFSCSLDVLLGGLGIIAISVLKKIFLALYIFFGHQNPVSGSDPDRQPKMLDPHPKPMSPDPKHWQFNYILSRFHNYLIIHCLK